MAKELEQTRGEFKIKGLVKGIDRDNAYEEGVRPDGRHAGRTFRKLNLGVQTSEDNQLRLGMFSYEPDEVFLWNNEKRKKDKNYKGERMPYEEYLQKKDILKANGTAVLQSRIGVETDEDGKLITHGLTSYEASEEIYDNVDNDDSVYVEGQISYSEYENRQGDMTTAVNYNINRLFKSNNDFDLQDENYEKQDYYEQQFVYVDSMVDKSKKQLIVVGRIIDYRKNTVDTNFVINYGEDKSMSKLAENVRKKFKFGDLVTVFGQLVNRTVEQDVEEEEDDLLSALGGKSQPSHVKRANFTYEREMTIDGVLEWERGFYTEDDFYENELVEEDDNNLTSELGGKKPKKNDNPFSESDDNDNGDPFDDDSDPFEDDSLPF